MAQWSVNPDQYGAFRFQLPPGEGESAGVPHDPFTRKTTHDGRKRYSLEKSYLFVELCNRWTTRDWPEMPNLGPPPDPEAEEITPGHPRWEEVKAESLRKVSDPRLVGGKLVAVFETTNPEYNEYMRKASDSDFWNAEKDRVDHEVFMTVVQCLGEPWISGLWNKLSKPERLNPSKSLRHHANLARHVLDALCCAVHHLADQKPVPTRIWSELTQRGGLVSLRATAEHAQADSRHFGIVGAAPWWVVEHMEPVKILHRAADSIVGSFFLYLLSVELGSPTGPRIKRCSESGCSNVLVASGRHTLCRTHQRDSEERGKAKSREQEKRRRAEWKRLKGERGARQRAYLKWRSRTKDARARWDRCCTALLDDGLNPAEVGYDCFKKYWNTTK